MGLWCVCVWRRWDVHTLLSGGGWGWERGGHTRIECPIPYISLWKDESIVRLPYPQPPPQEDTSGDGSNRTVGSLGGPTERQPPEEETRVSL